VLGGQRRCQESSGISGKEFGGAGTSLAARPTMVGY